MKFYMMVGIPSSGKSTVAKRIAEQENAVIIATDDLREELFNDVNSQVDNDLVFRTAMQRVKQNLKNRNVILDATNINYKRRMSMLHELNYIKDLQKIAVFVATPYEECLQRNKMRDRKVPENVIKRMYYNIYIPQYYEGFDDIQIIHNEIKPIKWEDLLNKMDMSQDNPHHTLTLKEHCMKVQEIIDSQSHHYYMRDVGLLHDIGKIETKSFINNHNDVEEWKDIKEFQNRYQVSNFGNIRNSRNMKVLKPRKHSGGYLQVNIRNKGKLKNYYIHRIVAQYFCENDINNDITNLDVNHKDGNKENNFYKNLEWCTRSENIKHCFYTNKERNRFGINVPNHKLSYDDIEEIKRIKAKEKLSNKEISEMFNISESQITRVLNGTTYTNKLVNKVIEVKPIVPQRYASYYNHEKVGAYISCLNIDGLWQLSTPDLIDRANLIQWHMLPYSNMSEKTINKYKKLLGTRTWEDLMLLHEADKEAH